MSDFEDLRMKDLIGKLKSDIFRIAETGSVSLFKQAGKHLQDVYNFHLTADKVFEGAEEYFKSLYSSFNYAAVIINNAIKEGGLKSDDNALLKECLEIMSACCDKIVSYIDGEVS